MIRLRKQKAANGRYANEDSSNPESPAPRMVLNDRSAGHRTYLRGQDDEQDEEDCESGSRFFEAEIPEVVEDADSNSETRTAEKTGQSASHSERSKVLRAPADDGED